MAKTVVHQLIQMCFNQLMMNLFAKLGIPKYYVLLIILIL